MKYVCLVYHDEKRVMDMPEAELDAVAAGCAAWVEDLEKTGHYVSSAGLQSVGTATTIRRRNGQVSTTDGPFAETKEFLGGFTILEARDLNEAIQLASRHPALAICTIEVRPVFDPSMALAEPIDQKFAASQRRTHPTPAQV